MNSLSKTWLGLLVFYVVTVSSTLAASLVSDADTVDLPSYLRGRQEEICGELDALAAGWDELRTLVAQRVLANALYNFIEPRELFAEARAGDRRSCIQLAALFYRITTSLDEIFERHPVSANTKVIKSVFFSDVMGIIKVITTEDYGGKLMRSFIMSKELFVTSIRLELMESYMKALTNYQTQASYFLQYLKTLCKTTEVEPVVDAYQKVELAYNAITEKISCVLRDYEKVRCTMDAVQQIIRRNLDHCLPHEIINH